MLEAGLDLMIREGLSGEMTFELEPGCQEASHGKKGRRNCVPGRGSSLCKGPGAGMSLASFRISREAGVGLGWSE